MSLRVVPHPAYRENLRAMPRWREDASRVDAAVLRFAATGEGRIEKARDGRTLRLIVRPFVVLMTIDRDAHALHVWCALPQR